MNDQIDSLNNVFSFKDAVKAVENMLHETIVERDSYGPVEGTGLYSDWDSYYLIQDRVNTIQDVLNGLKNETEILHHISMTDERGVEL